MITDIEKIENLLQIGEYEVMYRINHNGKRLYIREEPFKYYSGLTGAMDAATFKGDPEARALDGWRTRFIDQHGQETQENYLFMTAEFGTLLHEAIVTIKEKSKINWKEEYDRAEHRFSDAYRKRSMEPNLSVIDSMAREYQKHVASLMTWVYERVDAIYAVEVPARCEELNIATPIDVFCNCRPTPKGKFQKTTVNIKTSSQISQHQLDQVSCEMSMWNETYGDAEATGIIRTKNWKTKPSYEMKVIDEGEVQQRYNEISQRLRLCLNSGASYYPNPTNILFKGETEIGKEIDFSLTTLEEEWNQSKELETLNQ